MTSFWKQVFALSNALTRVHFSLHFCQLENSSEVRRNNEQHYSDQRKEYMRNLKYSPLHPWHKYAPSREKREKIARILLCPHWPWPYSQDVKACLYLQLPVACQPLWHGDHVSSLLIKWKRETENNKSPWPSFFGGGGVMWAILTFGDPINQPQTPESHGMQVWNHLLHYLP